MRKYNTSVKSPQRKRPGNNAFKAAVAILVAALIVVAVVLAIHSHNSNNLNSGNAGTSSNNNPTGSSGGSAAPVTKKSSGGSSSASQGGAVDKHGSIGTIPPQSQWTTSPSGQITLYSPAADSTLKSGDTISGSAKVATVWYRVIDDQAGQLAQGDLRVVNGKYSGVLNFRPYSHTGKLDVFSYNQDGAEINTLEVSVKL